MALQSWWQVVTPHSDISKGELDEAVFAADLGNVISGKAPQEYKDADLFFRKTYLTAGLQNLLGAVLGRLTEGKGSGVIQLQTPFGGGKTHALLALYHAVKNRSEIKRFENIKVLTDALPENTRVASFVGTHADPLKGKTPWGSIAHQLGFYEILRDHDKKRVAPGKERLAELFDASGPTLILIDELLEYVVKASKAEESQKVERGQVLAFLQELSEVVSASKNLVLVLTLPASALERYDEEAEKAMTQIQKISGRVEETFTPVEGMEIYEVIRTRLFETLGDSTIHKEVASAYLDLYQKMGNDVPPEVREVAYRQRIEKAYPFHPELIDALYERWGSFPTFQRTRGVLRLLGTAVQDLFKKKTVSPLIHSSLLLLENPKLRTEFVKHIGNEYHSVIEADISSPHAKTAKIDEEMGTEYSKYNIARGLATSIFLYSFSGGEKKGITLPQLRVSLIREGIEPTIVGDAVKKLEEELWYLHAEGNLFYFTNQPNLNRMIIDREETMKDEKIYSTIEQEVRNLAGKELDVVIFPGKSQDIPDNKKIRLVILSPKYLYPSETTKDFIEKLFSECGEGYRTYKNSLIILAIDSEQWNALYNAVKRFLALDSINRDEGFMNNLSPAAVRELSSKHEDAKSRIPQTLVNAYRHIALCSRQGARVMDMGFSTSAAGSSLGSRVRGYLSDAELLLPRISGSAIIDKAFAPDENEKSIDEIYELFLKTPGMPLIESKEGLFDSIKSSVKSGTLGVSIGGNVYFMEDIPFALEDAMVLTIEEANRRKKPVIVEEVLGDEDVKVGEGDEPSGIESTGVLTTTTKEKGPKRISIRQKIPSERISDLIRGVINPLKNEGATLEVTFEIEARSEEGFTRHTIDNVVKETLSQIGHLCEFSEEE